MPNATYAGMIFKGVHDAIVRNGFTTACRRQEAGGGHICVSLYKVHLKRDCRVKIERKNDLSLRLLEVFGAVMRCQTTIGAAEELGISQPAVSNSIKSLEAQLGFLLFERNNRRLRPTEEARLLLEEIEPIFGLLRNLEGQVRDLRKTRGGRLRLIATPPLGHTVLPVTLSGFLEERPSVTVRYDIRRLETVIQTVETGAAEVGFLLGLREHPALNVWPLHESAMVCVMPANHPLRAKDKITPFDIASVPLIGLESNLGAIVRAAFNSAGVPHLPRVEVRYCHTACVLANAGIGVAVVDPFSARFADTLNVITRPFEPLTMVAAAAVSRRDAPLSLLANSFVEEVRSRLAESEAGQ